MATLASIIRAPKASVRIGPWRTGKVPASAFPLAKQKRLPQSSAWQWRVVEFHAEGYDCRILVRLNLEAGYYSSILGIKDGELLQVLCHHEMHLSHRNWHCHFIPGNVDDTMPGVLRDTQRMRVYEAEPSNAGEATFEVDEASALGIAAKRFRFPAPDETPVQGSFL